MTASADKVQFILETLLEDSLPLTKKGIFTHTQLREMMTKRQKHENAMLRNQYKLSDYLKSIEYQYELERERRSRIDQGLKSQQVSSNPLFKKQSKTDFVIVKRIIKLWDRTMHKFRYKLHLWKQYLSFCIEIKSKKHFYKALTNALRFLPFQLDLWKIGAAYQVQIGHNLWKARKIFMKGIKMIPKGIKNFMLCLQMIKFEFIFLAAICKRNQIIVKGEQNGMKFVGEQNISSSQENEKQQQENINISEYDKVIWLIMEEAIIKNANETIEILTTQKLLYEIQTLLKEEQESNDNLKINQIIKHLQLKLAKSKNQGLSIQPKQQVQDQFLIQEEQELQNQQVENIKTEQDKKKYLKFSDLEKLNFWKEQLLESKNSQYSINWTKAEKVMKQFCLKPNLLKEIYSYLLQINFEQTVHFILTSRQTIKLPNQVISSLLQKINSNNFQALPETQQNNLISFLQVQVDHKITVNDLKANPQLLLNIIKFNRYNSRASKNTIILRSLTIHFKSQTEFIERCRALINMS